MNKQRRKQIQILSDKLADLITQCSAIRDEIETLRDDEQTVFDNMPEGLQFSERGQKTEAAADALGNACDAAEQAEYELQSAIDELGTAAE